MIKTVMISNMMNERRNELVTDTSAEISWRPNNDDLLVQDTSGYNEQAALVSEQSFPRSLNRCSSQKTRSWWHKAGTEDAEAICSISEWAQNW